MSGMLRNPAFAGLLAPSLLLGGIGNLPENEALQRLNLLDATLDPGAAPSLAELVRTTRSGAIRVHAVALLGRLGPGPMEEWTSLLVSSNFVVRRVALKQILELNSAAFFPLLTKYRESEALPGNRALASLALSRLVDAQGRTTEAVELLKSIPEGEDVYPVALGDLAGIAEREGRTDEALRLREKARMAADRQRMIAAPDEKAPGIPRER
jgi:hypothetical protein